MDIYSLVKQENSRIDQKYPESNYLLYAGKVAELLPRAAPLSFNVLQQIYLPGGVFEAVMKNLNEPVRLDDGGLLETFMGRVYVNLKVEKNILYQNQPIKYSVDDDKLTINLAFSFLNFYKELPFAIVKILRDSVRVRFVKEYVERCKHEYRKISKLSFELSQRPRLLDVETYTKAYYSCIYISFLHNFYYLWNRRGLCQDPFEKESARVYARVNNYLIRDDGELFNDNKYKSIEDFELRIPKVLEHTRFEGKKIVPNELQSTPDDLNEFEGAEVLLACLRDNARLKFLIFGYYLRQYFLRFADEHKLGDDVFFYNLTEIGLKRENISSVAESIIETRREIYEKGKELYLPNVLKSENIHKVAVADGGSVELLSEIAGTPCAGGFVRGRVQFIKDSTDKIKGEVLAFENASPAFTYYFKQASGLIFRVGSPLSHGSIIARELGIPAATIDIVPEFLDGKEVELDGTTGILKILTKNPDL